MTRLGLNRRTLLQTGAAAFALPTLIPASAFGANERVNVGVIGLGGRARTIVESCNLIPNMNVVSVCDCFKPDMDTFVNVVGKDQNWSTYEDFRKMMDDENLDGVMVETTTHARAWIAVQAMQAGMDAYIEKPMCLSIEEGRHMVNAARKYDRVTQVGTQQRSMPINNWASDLVKNGAIGKIKTVLAPNFVGPVRFPGGEAEPMPSGGMPKWWDVWTNQAEMRPYRHDLHHRWEKWWSYDGGGLCYGVTGWGTHSYDQIQRALGTDLTGPTTIILEEPVTDRACGKFETVTEVDETRLDYLIRLANPVEGPRAKMTMRYDNGTELKLHLDGDWGPGLGAIFVGQDGKLEINRNKIAASNKELLKSADNPGPIDKPETQYHIENWVDCIKTRERCNADIEIGLRSTTLCYLVNIAREVGRVGEPLSWDPETEQFTNCDEANKSWYVTRPRRKGYELPEL
ncbi:Gfo/Idh/MocA family protein [Novipirellula artificiosorum]|uniref:Glucose--fructose oxidoreductase n=1 Tax=Novipirellula artificiosorum TaxID=2528016 RepID=A0A5C6DBA6_9BACT|nr:Gfo/Idh/MocA family oxidoreductase [Novipirellula artificiosorum]TWU33037.1 Glucose--fructose oxidoreductase precursor [Novipirellula artificiosorum]